MAYFSAASQGVAVARLQRPSGTAAGSLQLCRSRQTPRGVLLLGTSTARCCPGLMLGNGVARRVPSSRVSLVVIARRGGGRRGGGGRGGRGRRGGRSGRYGQDDRRKNATLINEEIRCPEVRLVGADKEMIGVTPTFEAQGMADELGLDLVMITRDAEPPVCRLMDYKKHLFDQGKKEKEAQKRQRSLRVDVKELKLRYNIDTHDYEVRRKKAFKFLSGGDKVKFLCQFRGREMEFKDIALKMFEKLRDDLAEVGTMEGNRPNMEGRAMIMTLTPVKSKAAAAQAQEQEERNQRRAMEKAKRKAEIQAELKAAGNASAESDESQTATDSDGEEEESPEEELVLAEPPKMPVRPNALQSLTRPKLPEN